MIFPLPSPLCSKLIWICCAGSNVTLGFERGQNREPFVVQVTLHWPNSTKTGYSFREAQPDCLLIDVLLLQLTFGSPDFIANLDKGGKRPTQAPPPQLTQASRPPVQHSAAASGSDVESIVPTSASGNRDAEIRSLQEALKSEMAKVRVQVRPAPMQNFMPEISMHSFLWWEMGAAGRDYCVHSLFAGRSGCGWKPKRPLRGFRCPGHRTRCDGGACVHVTILVPTRLGVSGEI